MQLHYTPHHRIERLVAAGRVVLAASSLLAIWLDPTQPEKYVTVSYGLMAVYVLYSVGVAALVWTAPASRILYPLATHLVDLAAFSVFIFLTEGPPTSPFFVYFIFSILCATLRWGWRATLWTSLFSLAVFLGMGLLGGRALDDERLNRFIIRSVYLSVVATMLGYLGAYEEERRGEMAKLARGPVGSPRDARDVLHEALDYAAGVMNAPRVLLVWEEFEEPWVHRACRSAPASAMTWEREAPGGLEPVVPRPINEHAFFCLDAAAPLPTVLSLSPNGQLRSWEGAPLHPRLRHEYAVRAVVGAPLKGEVLRGWLFFLDRRRMTTDDMVVGEIVAQQVTSRLEHFYLLQKLQQSAVMEERGRLARDLHDGVLQSLAGTALQLHALRHTLGDGPSEVVDRLAELQSLIVAEHRQLRSFIRELRPAALVPSAGEGTLAAILGNLVNRVERHWGLRVELAVGDLDPGEAERLGYDISHIVHEALVNAARHGGGSAARVEVGARAGCITILVADNGHGFGFEGRYDLPALTVMKLGPATLKERVASLGGAFILESRLSGARLEITLPAPGVTG